ncbi:MAG: NAD(P)/FAD-dependent oxidoreductase [Desulfobaccales bacterium]
MTCPSASREIVIIGAGPAGATLAYALLQGGVKPLVLDQAAFPRVKVCAGGLTVKALKFLPPDLGAILENEIRRVHLSFNLDGAFTKASPQVLLYTVARQRFDAFLMERVRQAGGDFGDGERVEHITPGPGDFSTIVTSRRLIKARVVVGADGARSLVARCSGLQPVEFWHLGLQVEIPRQLVKTIDPEFSRTIFLDLGTMADGYGWGFPRGETLVIGVGGPIHQGWQLKRYHARLLSRLGLGDQAFPLAAHLIPHRVTPRPIMRGRVLLVGDAAGLADYWTGEGIFSALQSADLAARQILRFFRGEAGALPEYQARVDREITPGLRASYQFSKLCNYLGSLAFRCLEHYDYPWEAFCRVMRGDRSLLEVKKGFRPDILIRKLLVKSARNRTIT